MAKRLFYLRSVSRAAAVVAALLAAACSAAGYGSSEHWLTSGEHPNYPAGRYVVGVGFGDTMRDADNMAMGEVAKYFHTEVVTVTRDEQDYSQTTEGGETTVVEKFESRTFARVRGRAEIDGIEIKDRLVVNGQHHSLAVLDRVAASRRLARELAKLQMDMEGYELMSREDPDPGNKIRRLARALYLGDRSEELARRLAVLDRKVRPALADHDGMAVRLHHLLKEHYPVVVRSTSTELGGQVKEELRRRGLVVVDDAEGAVALSAALKMEERPAQEGVMLFYEVSLSATRGSEVLAQLNWAERLSHPDPKAARLKAMYEIRVRAVGPFADDLSKAVLGDYSTAEESQ